MSLNQINLATSRPKIMAAKNVSLSSFFPVGTRFFYAYPAGEDSGFLNRVSPATEELVAARVMCCAGPDVLAVVFAATAAPSLDPNLLQIADIPQLTPKQRIVLPADIDISLQGHDRNQAIKDALSGCIRPGSLVMAQPYTDSQLSGLFEISPDITTWLNDKHNMPAYIDEALLPARLGSYASGAAFVAAHQHIKLPAVVKVTSSSSGDGVYICHTAEDMQRAADELQHIVGSILVEQYIDARKNYGVHFGIPFLSHKPAKLLGINEQLTSKAGEFLGGVIDTTEVPAELGPVIEHLLQDILPHVRAKGWYGIGGFDVLVDNSGKQYFIDCNFRMTGMSAYHFLVANDVINTPLVSFGGEFHGSQAEFENQILPYAAVDSEQRFLQLIALSNHDNVWRFNGALCYKNLAEQKSHAQTLLDHGVESAALSQLV